MKATKGRDEPDIYDYFFSQSPEHIKNSTVRQLPEDFTVLADYAAFGSVVMSFLSHLSRRKEVKM